MDPQDSVSLNAALQAVGVSSSFQWVVNGTHGWETEPFGPIMPSWPQILQMELDFFDRYLKS